jgi:hypothetical protein
MDSIRYSEIESKRFGKEIFRGNIDVLDIERFKKFYEQNDPDILIVRIPVSEQHKMSQLNSLNKEVINADTLVYYQVGLDKTIYNPVKNKELVFVNANISNKSAFEQLISEVFKNYTNHYFSNPILDKKKITEGYTEWATQSIHSPGNLHVLVYTDTKPTGFITCSYNSNFAEIILNGVLPEYQGRGIYTDMIRHVKDHFHRISIPVLKVSTQIQNFAVQKVWNKEGFILNSAYITIHLNKK